MRDAAAVSLLVALSDLLSWRMASEPLTLDPVLSDRIRATAAATDRPAEELLADVVQKFLDEDAYRQAVRDGLDDIAAGRTLDYEETKRAARDPSTR